MQAAALCQCAAPPTQQRGVLAARGRPQQRQVAAAAKQQQRKAAQQPGEAEPLSPDLPVVPAPAAVPEQDPWEGEQFEILGKLASAAIPLIVAAAIGIGLFATSTYNEGATVFLDTPKNQSDTVRLVPAEQLSAPPAQ